MVIPTTPPDMPVKKKNPIIFRLALPVPPRPPADIICSDIGNTGSAVFSGKKIAWKKEIY